MTTTFDSFDGSPHGAFVESPHGARNRVEPLFPGVGINPIIFVIGANRPITRHVWAADFRGAFMPEEQVSPWEFVRTEEYAMVTPNYDDVAKWDEDIERLADALSRVENFDWGAHNRIKPNYQLVLIHATVRSVLQQLRTYAPNREEWGIVTNDFSGLPGLLHPPGRTFPASIRYRKMQVPTFPVSRYFTGLQPIPNSGNLQTFMYGRIVSAPEDYYAIEERMLTIFKNEWLDLMGNDTLNPRWRYPPDGEQKYQVILRAQSSGFGLRGGASPTHPFVSVRYPKIPDVIKNNTPSGVIATVNYDPYFQAGRWLDQFARTIVAQIP